MSTSATAGGLGRSKTLRASTILLVAGIGGCTASIDTSASKPSAEPVEPTRVETMPEGSEPGEKAEERTEPGAPDRSSPEPTIVRTHGLTVVTTPNTEQVLLLPSSVVWVADGQLYELSASGSAVERFADAGIDPHGVATDGQWLYWAAEDKNRRSNLVTRDVETFPNLANAPGSLVGFATAPGVAERLFVMRRHELPVLVFDFATRHAEMIRTDDWPGYRGFPEVPRVRGKFLYLSGMMRRGGETTAVLLRSDLRGRAKIGSLPGRVRSFQWDVDVRHRVIAIDPKTHELLRVSFDGKPPSIASIHDVKAACWCGEAICAWHGDGLLRRHPSRGEPQTLLTGWGAELSSISCEPERLAWATTSEVSVLELGASRG